MSFKLSHVFAKFFCLLVFCLTTLSVQGENFLEQAKKAIDSHSIISFDIFDTLILRLYVRPIDLFIHLEKLNNCSGFTEQRILAERSAHENTNDEEVTLNEIYECIPSKFKKFKDVEIELEYNVVRPNPEIKKLYDYALKKGKKLIITSDMYLPRQTIEKILSKCGYADYYKLYLSSERKKTKNSSNLYREILSELKISPQNIIHIGDNYFSDCEQARTVGIDSLYYPKVTHNFLNNPYNEKFKEFYEQNDELFRSIVVSQLAYKQKQNENLAMSKSKYWYDVGYQIGGPFLFAFCDFVSRQPFLKTCGTVAFIGRDGYAPWRVFQILNPKIPAKYIYAPRIIGRICNLDLLSHFSVKGCNEIYKNYFARDFGDIKFSSLEEWKFFIDKNFNYLKKLSESRKEEYKKYLASQCNLNQNLMIVDSSTSTWTVQKLLQGVFNSEVMGCYAWVDRDVKTNFKYADFFKNIKTPLRKFINWDFVEFLMTAPESPIIDIVNNEIIHKNPSSEEKNKNEIVQYVVNGAMDFARDAREILKNSDMNANAVFDLINDFSDYPNFDDVKYRGSLMNCADVSHSHYRRFFYDKVKVSVLALFSFHSIHGERIARFWNSLPFAVVVPAIKERVVYLFGILPIIRMQIYPFTED